ncbi:MAG: lipocalin-like domain-containing protein [Okeania sp. SIO3I5]|uniref:lipocalin-like domain-containing protein n=1 Tax=Okeania sp. SIO3I5 TaxID=2607805 RepID=UPI0013B5CDBE|nr:lipocalin-like domain-containing protein [Okeania sp. SIO3I5]NEQ41291.1 lipocalin-like domain-containing protein [Okeania sp. SIO3I5]
MTHSIVSKDDLVGIWKFIEVKYVDKQQNTIDSYGKNPVGYLIYTQEGYVAISIMMRDRLKLGLPVEEIQALGYGAKPKLIQNLFGYIRAIFRYVQAGNNYAAYIGKYEIIDNKVIHHIEVNIVPDAVGTVLEQTIEISGDKLVLTRSGVNIISATLQRVS